MGEDLGNRHRIGEERDEGEGGLAGGTDEWEHLVDPGQESGPPGRRGGGGVLWLGCWVFRLGTRSRGGCWERKAGTEALIGQGVVLLGPGRDQRPQRSIGSEDPMVAVPVEAGRREDLGQAIQEFESGETQGSAAGGIGLRQDVENLVGSVVDEMKAVESEGRPGTVADQTFEASAVGVCGKLCKWPWCRIRNLKGKTPWQTSTGLLRRN